MIVEVKTKVEVSEGGRKVVYTLVKHTVSCEVDVSECVRELVYCLVKRSAKMEVSESCRKVINRAVKTCT